jgi:hypothetical protein
MGIPITYSGVSMKTFLSYKFPQVVGLIFAENMRVISGCVKFFPPSVLAFLVTHKLGLSTVHLWEYQNSCWAVYTFHSQVIQVL